MRTRGIGFSTMPLWRHAVWPCAVLAVYLVLYGIVLSRPEWRDHLPPVCSFRAITHVPCPTCGGTRATIALASGQVSLAFRYNPLISAAWLLLPAALLGAFVFRARALSVSPAMRTWVVRGVVLVLVVVGLANWIYVLGNLREVERSDRHGSLRTAAGAHSPRGAGGDGP